MIKHYTDIRVQGFHIDVNGHVNNARYLEFMETARWEYLQKYFDYAFFEEQGWNFVIVRINIRYKRASLLNEELEVETYIKEIGDRIVTMMQTIRLKGTKLIASRAEVSWVLYDQKSEKSVKLSPDLLKHFKLHDYQVDDASEEQIEVE